jgi:alpha-glucosidase (family GH31 glycosyl hydrolase)
VNAPIDTLPLFVRAGSIVPFGFAIENTTQSQRIEHVRVYDGADADFALYQDDGETYAYETGGGLVTSLHWNDVQGHLTHEGAAAWAAPDSSVVEVIGK